MERFGTTRAGAAVHAVDLQDGVLTARVLTFGAILQDLRLEGRPLTLGAPALAAYDGGPMAYFGAVVGPLAGRVRNARAPLGGGHVALDSGDHPHALHSGTAGLHRAVWEVAEAAADRVRLVARAEAGAGGLPGARRFAAVYTLEKGALRLTLEAETDAPTLVNLTHHGYWHLGGPPGLDGHRLWIAADRYLPIDAETLPTGEILPVEGSRFDFREGRRLEADDTLDHCFCLAGRERSPVEVARLEAPDGTALVLTTSAPGLQVFTGDGVATRGHAGHGGAAYGARPGLALEPQGWPDAPNHRDFPPIRLDPGKVWRREIAWHVIAGPRRGGFL
jgi:aldose 1-epimerase